MLLYTVPPLMVRPHSLPNMRRLPLTNPCALALYPPWSSPCPQVLHGALRPRPQLHGRPEGKHGAQGAELRLRAIMAPQTSHYNYAE